MRIMRNGVYRTPQIVGHMSEAVLQTLRVSVLKSPILRIPIAGHIGTTSATIHYGADMKLSKLVLI